MNKNEYKSRIIDEKINKYLSIAKAILITGPKWCGKTWTSLYHSNSDVSLMDKKIFELANVDPNYILKDDYPQLIDEWQVVPEIWDAVRNKCDKDNIKGKYILTGSTTLRDEEKEKIKHSGIGRIIPITMFPMTLYEQGISSDNISLMDLKEGNVDNSLVKGLTVMDYANIIIRGGFPENIDTPLELINELPKSYIEAVCNEDINKGKSYKKNPRWLHMLLASLARNECTITNNSKIISDIANNSLGSDSIKNSRTLDSYMDYLDSINLLWYQDSFSTNYRSKARLGVKAKRHFVDTSLASAALNLTPNKLLNDFNTFGFLFESLVERDLKVYMDLYGGNVMHFRDNLSGDEVDAICEFDDGEYGAIEIKLSGYGIDDAKKSLLRFYDNVLKKPCFMCIIVGEYNIIHKDSESGIYIIPFSALGLHKK